MPELSGFAESFTELVSATELSSEFGRTGSGSDLESAVAVAAFFEGALRVRELLLVDSALFFGAARRLLGFDSTVEVSSGLAFEAFFDGARFLAGAFLADAFLGLAFLSAVSSEEVSAIFEASFFGAARRRELDLDGSDFDEESSFAEDSVFFAGALRLRAGLAFASETASSSFLAGALRLRFAFAGVLTASSGLGLRGGAARRLPLAAELGFFALFFSCFRSDSSVESELLFESGEASDLACVDEPFEGALRRRLDRDLAFAPSLDGSLASVPSELLSHEALWSAVSDLDSSSADFRVGALRVARRRRDLGLLSLSDFGSITSKPSGVSPDVSLSDLSDSDFLSLDESEALSLELSSF